MSVLSTDLIAYASARMPNDDTSPYGGAINTGMKVTFTDIAVTDYCAAYSSVTGDISQTVTINGRISNGSIAEDTIAIAGTGKVANSIFTFERILSATINAAHVGTVTLARNNGPTYNIIGTMEPGVTGITRLFNKAFSSPTGNKDYYEKIFIKNTHTGLALLGAIVTEVASGAYNLIDFTLEASQDSNASGANRLTAPATGVRSEVFSSTAKAVPSTDLANTASIGVWIHLPLASGAAAQKNTYTLQIDGTST